MSGVLVSWMTLGAELIFDGYIRDQALGGGNETNRELFARGSETEIRLGLLKQGSHGGRADVHEQLRPCGCLIPGTCSWDISLRNRDDDEQEVAWIWGLQNSNRTNVCDRLIPASLSPACYVFIPRRRSAFRQSIIESSGLGSPYVA